MTITENQLHYHTMSRMGSTQCTLCGENGGFPFKEAAVCEDCVKYVKSLE